MTTRERTFASHGNAQPRAETSENRGQLAQRQSTVLTRRGSQVQSLHCPNTIPVRSARMTDRPINASLPLNRGGGAFSFSPEAVFARRQGATWLRPRKRRGLEGGPFGSRGVDARHAECIGVIGKFRSRIETRRALYLVKAYAESWTLKTPIGVANYLADETIAGSIPAGNRTSGRRRKTGRPLFCRVMALELRHSARTTPLNAFPHPTTVPERSGRGVFLFQTTHGGTHA